MSATGRARWAWLFATASSADPRSARDQDVYVLVATQTRELGGTGVHPGEGKKDDPLQQVFRRLDAIQEMVRRREGCKGGCIIGNMSTARAALPEYAEKWPVWTTITA